MGTAQGVAFGQPDAVQGLYFPYPRSWTKVPLVLFDSDMYIEIPIRLC